MIAQKSKLSWKSTGLPDESIKPPSRFDNRLNPSLNYIGTKTRAEIKGNYLKQDKITFCNGKVVNIYIVYEINKNLSISSYPELENFLFGAVKSTRHPDINQYKYSGYDIGIDRKGYFSLVNEIDENVIIFGVDMSSSSHIDNK